MQHRNQNIYQRDKFPAETYIDLHINYKCRKCYIMIHLKIVLPVVEVVPQEVEGNCSKYLWKHTKGYQCTQNHATGDIAEKVGLHNSN